MTRKKAPIVESVDPDADGFNVLICPGCGEETDSVHGTECLDCQGTGYSTRLEIPCATCGGSGFVWTCPACGSENEFVD